MTPEEDRLLAESWIRLQAKALDCSVTDEWTLPQCITVLMLHIQAPTPEQIIERDLSPAFAGMRYITNAVASVTISPEGKTILQNSLREVQAALHKHLPDARIGKDVEYSGEDSYFAGRVAGVIKKFDRVTGEQTGPERFVVQDERGLLLIKNVKDIKK